MIAGGLLTLQNTEGINALRKFRSDEWISLSPWVDGYPIVSHNESS